MFTARVIALTVSILLLSCGEDKKPTDKGGGGAGCPTSPALFASEEMQTIWSTNCTTCHNAQEPRLVDAADLKEHRVKALSEVKLGDMPPSNQLQTEEKAKIIQMLECDPALK